MSFETLGDVNYLAVLVATVAWAILGAIWYAPSVLGRALSRASGWDMPERPPSAMYLAASLLLYFIAALATAWIARETGSGTFSDSIALGLAVGIGYMTVLAAVTPCSSGSLTRSPGSGSMRRSPSWGFSSWG